MNKRYQRLAVASAIMCVFGTTAYAAQQDSAAQKSTAPAATRSGAIDIVTWDQAELRQGYSAERLLDMKAKGRSGETIGDVKDILVDSNGKVSALLVSHGGVLGIGDKELRVPFDQIKPDAKLESLSLPIAKDNVDDFRIRGDRQAGSGRAGGEMKMSELLDDKVTLRGGAKYGDVQDVIISRNGEVKAIVVDADTGGRRGWLALPWLRNAYDSARNEFAYDYDRNQIDRLRPFDYASLQIAEPGRPASAGRAADTSRTGGTPGRAGEGAAGSGSSSR